MSVSTFGVTADLVRRHFFPSFQPWGVDTSPSSVTVGEEVTWAASDLDGQLRTKGVDPSSITDATSAAYTWCAKTLALMVACAVVRAMTGTDPKLAVGLQKQLDERLARLLKLGVDALGQGASDSGASPAQGPLSHITQLGLSVGDTGLASTAAPIFRKDDFL